MFEIKEGLNIDLTKEQIEFNQEGLTQPSDSSNTTVFATKVGEPVGLVQTLSFWV